MINFNKGISTPTALTIIIVLAVVSAGGIFAYQHYLISEEEKKIFETSEMEALANPIETFIEECNKTTEKERASCLTNLAVDSHNVLVCEEIKDKKFKNFCYETISWVIKDSYICDQIQDELSIKASCYSRVAIRNADFSLCEKIVIPYLKYRCYTRVAEAKKDSLICDKHSIQQYKDFCYGYVNHDVKICYSMKEDYFHNETMCYAEMARISQNVSICEMIEDQGWKIACYIGVALEKKDASICPLIPVSEMEMRDICYKHIAIETKNTSICKKIENQKLKRICYSFAK